MDNTNSFKKLTKAYFISALVGLGIYAVCFILFNFILPKFVTVSFGIQNAVNGGYLFGDFAETLAYPLAPNPYSGDSFGIKSIYPPFAIYLCAPLSLICKGALYDYLEGKISLGVLSTVPSFRIAFFIYFLLTVALIMLFICLFLKEKNKLNHQTFIALLMFSPFFFAFVRGNNTLSICLFTVMFFYFMEKDNWMKELGYISFACAAAMRLYPLLMIFYIIYKAKGNEKIFGTLKALGYTIVIIFVPFLLTEGGFGNIKYLFQNAFGFGAIDAGASDVVNVVSRAADPAPVQWEIFESATPYSWPCNSSIMTVVRYFFGGLKYLIPSLPAVQLIDIVSKIMRFSLVAFAVVLPIVFNKAKCDLEFSILAVATYMLFPNVCNGYCLTLMVVPFMFMLLNYENIKAKDKWIYIVCFGVLACPASFAFNCAIQHGLATIILTVKAITVIIRENIPLMKTKTAH